MYRLGLCYSAAPTIDDPIAAAAGARDCAPPAMAGTHGAPQRSTNPATTGCPATRRACAPFVSITIRITMTIRTLSGSTKLATKFATKLNYSFQLPTITMVSLS